MAKLTHDQTIDEAEQLALSFPKDSKEYTLLVRYTQKKNPTHNRLSTQNNDVGEAKTGSINRNNAKKRKKSRLSKYFSCFRTEKKKDVSIRQRASDITSPHQEDIEQIVNKLTQITDQVYFTSTEIETDSDDVVERIVELIREHGDKLNEKIEKDHVLRKKMQDCFTYAFFKQVTQRFLRRVSPAEYLNTQSPEKTKIALTCELTSRLNTMECLPMNRALGFGAKYLQDYFTPWVIDQGGYEKVFGTSVDEDEEVH